MNNEPQAHVDLVQTKERKLDVENRYIFNNWSDQDFACKWDGKERIIKAKETIEVPEYLALHYTKHFVNKQMILDGKEQMMGIPEKRKEYEDKCITALTQNIDSPALTSLKDQIRAEIEAQLKEGKPAVYVAGKKGKAEPEEVKKDEEFADLKK